MLDYRRVQVAKMDAGCKFFFLSMPSTTTGAFSECTTCQRASALMKKKLLQSKNMIRNYGKKTRVIHYRTPKNALFMGKKVLKMTIALHRLTPGPSK